MRFVLAHQFRSEGIKDLLMTPFIWLKLYLGITGPRLSGVLQAKKTPPTEQLKTLSCGLPPKHDSLNLSAVRPECHEDALNSPPRMKNANCTMLFSMTCRCDILSEHKARLFWRNAIPDCFLNVLVSYEQNDSPKISILLVVQKYLASCSAVFLSRIPAEVRSCCVRAKRFSISIFANACATTLSQETNVLARTSAEPQ